MINLDKARELEWGDEVTILFQDGTTLTGAFLAGNDNSIAVVTESFQANIPNDSIKYIRIDFKDDND